MFPIMLRTRVFSFRSASRVLFRPARRADPLRVAGRRLPKAQTVRSSIPRQKLGITNQPRQHSDAWPVIKSRSPRQTDREVVRRADRLLRRRVVEKLDLSKISERRRHAGGLSQRLFGRLRVYSSVLAIARKNIRRARTPTAGPISGREEVPGRRALRNQIRSRHLKRR